VAARTPREDRQTLKRLAHRTKPLRGYSAAESAAKKEPILPAGKPDGVFQAAHSSPDTGSALPSREPLAGLVM